MVASNSEVELVLQQVITWPAEFRMALARRVLETIPVESMTIPGGLKGRPSEQVLGLWSSGVSAPTDFECEEILTEELDRKHAS